MNLNEIMDIIESNHKIQELMETHRSYVRVDIGLEPIEDRNFQNREDIIKALTRHGYTPKDIENIFNGNYHKRYNYLTTNVFIGGVLHNVDIFVDIAG